MRRAFHILLFLAILVHVSAASAVAKSRARANPDKLDVRAAMVMDFGTGRVLYEQDADRRIPPASITKIMTMYLVFEDIQAGRLRESDRVRVSARAAATGGSTMHLKAGETVTVRELLDGMAVASGNDACVAMAEHLGGTDAFIRRMNRKASEMGMTSTTFETVNGLPSPGQYTTARDMMKLSVSYLKRFPQSLEHHSKTVITHRGRNRYNSNKLLQSCDGVDGIKTGWVAASGYNIVTTAKRGNSRIIAVVLGGRSWQIRNRETKKIMEACFTPAGQKTYLAEKTEPSAKSRPGSARLELADPSARASFGQPPRDQGSPLPSQGSLDEAQATVVPMSGPELRAVAAPPPAVPAKPAIAAASVRAPLPFTPKPFQPDAAAYQPASLPVPRTVAETASTEASRGELTIQESSWKNPDEAQARVRLLESKGVSARVETADLGDMGIWHRVMIGSFSTMREARRYMRQLTNRFDL
ncbi:MAG: D-alanyl-D-alanine carboxypeptidase, partial [Desulfovibrio sp.]|nr:D-alanyl-D-alanine carboxypeptidase [Desulfovibrio sp.]